MTDRQELLELAAASGLPVIDLSLGVPAEPTPRLPAGAPGGDAETAPAAYPPSAGSDRLRAAAAGHLHRRYGIRPGDHAVAACVGTKEFIATLPLMLRHAGRVPPGRDTVLVPGLCYPTYAAGARLAGYRTLRVPVDPVTYRMRLDLLPDGAAARAVCLWVNSPCNPTGAVEDLGRVVAWGRARAVPVLSDEAYAETVWDGGPPDTVLRYGSGGLLAVHSLSKRSHAPGLRVGHYAGDPDLVARLVALRRDAGLMASAAAQEQAARFLDDDEHAAAVRTRNRARVTALSALFAAHGLPERPPALRRAGLFLWQAAPDGDGDAFARALAARAGLVVMPGTAYGPGGRGHVRVAAVRDAAELAPRLPLLTAPASRPVPEPRLPFDGRPAHGARPVTDLETSSCPTPF